MVDTLKEYINMCEMAVDVQDSYKPFLGDYVYCMDYNTETKRPSLIREVNGGSLAVLELVDYLDSAWHDEFTWLPRQDQLQAMVLPSKCNAYWLVNQLHYMCHNNNAYGLTGNPSMEQLWLAFVMFEKYNKTWNGQEWTLQNQ